MNCFTTRQILIQKCLQRVRTWNEILTTRQTLKKNLFFKKHEFEEKKTFKKHDFQEKTWTQ